MKYFEGIDKIGVILNPIFFNKTNINRHKDPLRKLTLHPHGKWCTLAIHDEWFNPFFDYQLQIAMAIHVLVKEGVIDFPDNIFTLYLIYKNIYWFILNITSIEFYSDFKRENIYIDENILFQTIDKAKEESGFYQYYDKKTASLTDTYYSPDKKGSRKSLFIVYEKLEKMIKENNHASVETLIKYQNPVRCEYKVYSNNSTWLHWDNLKGTYKDIFDRYKSYLAVIYNNYVAGNIVVKGNENPNFKSIIDTAMRQNKIRFTNNGKSKLKQKAGVNQDMEKDAILSYCDELGRNNSFRKTNEKVNKKAAEMRR
jgi:hypothetical protein